MLAQKQVEDLPQVEARRLGAMVPASSWEMSSSAFSSSPIEPMQSWMSLMIASPAVLRTRRSSAVTKSPSACNGWRRSWLAAARKVLFARLARSANSFAASS